MNADSENQALLGKTKQSFILQARSRGVGGEESPPTRLKKVQSALNIKHALFDAMV